MSLSHLDSERENEFLSVGGRGSNSFCLGVLEYPMFGPVVEEAKRKSRRLLCLPLKDSDFRPAIVLPLLFLGL